MRQLKFLYAVTCGLMMLNSACSDNDEPIDQKSPYTNIPLTEQTRSVIDKENDFAVSFFSNMAEVNENANFCVSTYSMFVALSMAANGDNDQTSRQIIELLTDGQVDISTLNEYNKMLMEYLPVLDAQSKCAINNSVWHDPSLSITESFANAMKDYYNGTLFAVAPSGNSGRDAINDWVKKKTNGMIPEFLKEPKDCDVAMINSAYFNAKWETPFNAKDTQKDTFCNYDSSTSEVDMMHQTKILKYASTDKLQMVRLPYGNGNFVMEIVTTTDNCAYAELTGVLKTEIKALRDDLERYDIQFAIPKFSVSNQFSAIDCLKKMGLTQSSLDGMLKGNALDTADIVQETVLKIDESGTEAAAITYGGMQTDPGYKEAKLTLNKPFVYMIREASTGTILFMGRQIKF